MKFKREELRKEGKVVAGFRKVSGMDMAKAFGVTKEHLLETVKILQDEEMLKIQDPCQHDYLVITI